MSFKFLPAQDNWEKALAAVKVKPDSALSKALDESFHLDADQPAKRLAMLPKILKLALDFKKSKVVVAAGPAAAKLVQELIDVIPVVKKEREHEIAEFQKTGAREVGVQILVDDWRGTPFDFGDGYATFECSNLPKITKQGKLNGNGLRLDDVCLRPVGTVNLSIKAGSQYIEGNTDFELGRGKDTMIFKAVQAFKTHKTRAKSVSEAANKSGYKGEVGVEFKVVKVGGEVTRESEYKQGYEDEVEWELEGGLPSFLPFTQTK